VGRYLLFDEIAAGGMAAVHIGRLLGPAGFSRTVAIKRLHAQFARDPEVSSMFLDEARLAARIRHPNVVSTLDIVECQGELFLVMDYVHGLSVARLWALARRQNRRVPLRVASGIVIDTLAGLSAAHEAKNDYGDALGIVHRDVSPQNILLGADGVARVADFGVAKARSRAQTTFRGYVKGKLAYMSPEQLQSQPVDQRTDVFAASVVLWELLTGERLFRDDDQAATIAKIMLSASPPPSALRAELDPRVDHVVARGLAKAQSDRFETARDMARALEASLPRAGALEIEDWISSIAGEPLKTWSERLAEIEEASVDPDRYVGLRGEKTATHPVRPPGARVEVEWSESSGPGAVLSAVTDLSASRAAAASGWSRRSWALTAAGALVVAVASATVFGQRGGTARVETAPAAGREASAVPVSKDSTAAPSILLVNATQPEAMATPTASALEAKPEAKRLHRARGKLVRSTCNPPFALRPDGSKRFKRECF
jgi:serine/threonine-protein kinase